jgi:hypothetical protein
MVYGLWLMVYGLWFMVQGLGIDLIWFRTMSWEKETAVTALLSAPPAAAENTRSPTVTSPAGTSSADAAKPPWYHPGTHLIWISIRSGED